MSLSKRNPKALVSRLVCWPHFKVNVWLLHSLGGHALPPLLLLSCYSSPHAALLLELMGLLRLSHFAKRGGGGC